MTDATPDPATRWTVTATYATGDRDYAHKALRTLAGVVATDADSDLCCTTARAEIETSTDTPGTYGQTFAAEMDAADGLDDQDGPVVRCRQYAEDDLSETTVWALKPDGTWLTATANGWRRMAGGHDRPDTPLDELESLGWVEIPIGRQMPAAAPTPTVLPMSRAELERAWMLCPVDHVEQPCDTCGWPGADAIATSEEQASE